MGSMRSSRLTRSSRSSGAQGQVVAHRGLGLAPYAEVEVRRPPLLLALLDGGQLCRTLLHDLLLLQGASQSDLLGSNLLLVNLQLARIGGVQLALGLQLHHYRRGLLERLPPLQDESFGRLDLGAARTLGLGVGHAGEGRGGSLRGRIVHNSVGRSSGRHFAV